MTWRFEAPHGSLPLSRRLVREFCPIVEAFVLPMFDARQHLTLGCAIACQLVRDNHPRHVLTPFEEFAEKLLGSRLIQSALHQNIEDGATVIDRSPQIVLLAVDFQEDFVEMPCASRLRTS